MCMPARVLWATFESLESFFPSLFLPCAEARVLFLSKLHPDPLGGGRRTRGGGSSPGDRVRVRDGC